MLWSGTVEYSKATKKEAGYTKALIPGQNCDEAVEAAAEVLRPMLDDAVRPRPTSYEAARAALTAAYPHLFIDALVQYAPTFKDYLRRRYG